MEDATKEYFRQGTKQFFTDSPFPISSSMWLNDARVRDYVSTHCLRRNHKEVPLTIELTQIIPILIEYQKHGTGFVEALFTAERQKNPALDAWFEEGFVSSLTTESLKDYPKDSVGNIFYRYLVANDFIPEFKGVPTGAGQLDYFTKRLSQQHDLEHIVGGFGFEEIGEQGVTWMRVAAYQRYLSPELAGLLYTNYAFLLCPPLMRTMLNYPQTLDVVWDTISRGMLIGRTSEPIFMMKYEPVLHLPLAEAREKLGYRNVQDVDISKVASVWSEGAVQPIDPRVEPMPVAAE